MHTYFPGQADRRIVFFQTGSRIKRTGNAFIIGSSDEDVNFGEVLFLPEKCVKMAF